MNLNSKASSSSGPYVGHCIGPWCDQTPEDAILVIDPGDSF